MKILFDGYIYRVQNAGGINRYLANIIDRLPQNSKPVISVRHVPELNFSKHPPKRKAPFLLTVREMIAEIFSHELEWVLGLRVRRFGMSSHGRDSWPFG